MTIIREDFMADTLGETVQHVGEKMNKNPGIDLIVETQDPNTGMYLIFERPKDKELPVEEIDSMDRVWFDYDEVMKFLIYPPHIKDIHHLFKCCPEFNDFAEETEHPHKGNPDYYIKTWTNVPFGG
jgi:hypothetical protein